MNTFRVDLTPETLRQKKGVRTRLMRDVKKVLSKIRKDLDEPPRYLWKRRTDGSLGYWFQFSGDIKDNKSLEILKAHGWAPSAAPVLPQSEWKRL